MGLFTPAWQSKNPEKRLSSLRKLSDETLFQIAINDENSTVRKYAVDGISDVNLLKKVVLNSKDSGVIVQSLRKLGDGIQDSEFIVQYAVQMPENIYQAPYEYVMRLINSQEYLIRVAKETKNKKIAEEARSKITDENVIADYARKRGYFTESDVEKISSQKILTEIALGDGSEHLRATATRKLKDNKLLHKIATTDCEALVQWAAVDAISDLRILMRLSDMHVCNVTVRVLALMKEIQNAQNERDRLVDCLEPLN